MLLWNSSLISQCRLSIKLFSHSRLTKRCLCGPLFLSYLLFSACQLLFITSFLIIFIACLSERQNFQAKMGPGVTKHNIYKSYSWSNNQSNLFRTCSKSQWVWVYSLHAFNFFLFVIPRFLVNTGRMKELVKEEISVTKVCLYQFQSWPPNTNQY